MLNDFDISDFNGKSVDQCCQEMRLFVYNYTTSVNYKNYSNFRFKVSYYGHDGGKDMELIADREEDDREFNARIKSEATLDANLKKKAEKKKETDFKTWERLNKKYGKLKTK